MSRFPECITCDFETHGIEPRPHYPPKPVSLALHWPGESQPRCMAWGHEAGGNNCTEKEARGEYLKARNSKYPMLFQYAMFDTDTAEAAWDIPLPNWDQYHDTMFLIALWDPHAPTLSLKPTAQRLLGIKPEEQDRLHEWIIANVPEAKKKPGTAGAYIWKAPYSVVRPYHVGDLTRTSKLFKYLYPRIVDAGMLEAYQRELKLMPILLENARVGMRVDVRALEQDLPAMKAGVEKTDVWLRKKLGIENIDSDKQLGNALYEKGIVTEFHRTAKGQLSVSKKHMTVDRFKDKRVYHALQYRGQMSTSVNMFGEPWLELATQSRTHDTLHPNWAQVRSPKGENDTSGARSMRIICTKPNLLNISKKWKRAFTSGYIHPAWLNVPELPYMRKYCLPDKGEQWGKRDINQQELRLFAHFEEGPVMEGFLTDPKFDIHEDVRAEAEARLIEAQLRDSFDRDTAKTCVFGRLYGQGITGLLQALSLPDEDKPVAQIIQRAINAAVPSIKLLDDALKALVKEGNPIRTWGGRLYYVEPPTYSEKYGRDMTYDYKMISYLMQGSGADVIKECIIRWHSHPKRTGRMTVSVYDEIDFSSKAREMKRNQEALRETIRSIETDVPMLSDGEAGMNWGELSKFKEAAA